MIKIMSFFALPIVEERIGEVHSLALSAPRNVGAVHETVHCLCPTWEMVRQYKLDRDEEAYTNAYRKLVCERWLQIKRWLDGLDPSEDLHLCCWERTGFCHRYLVAKLIRKFRPDLEMRAS